MENKEDSLKYFIFNLELIEISKENNLEKLYFFKKKYPENNDTIDQAFILLQNLKVVDVVSISEEKIEKEYSEFLKKVNRKKRIKFSLWVSVASVACACLFFIVSNVFHSLEPDLNYKDQMFSALDSMKQQGSDEIQIVTGNKRVFVANNEQIKQSEEGNVIVGENEKIKSEDIKTEYIQLMVPNGRRTNLTLNDGTKVWLNSGSKLLYPKMFSKNKREIFIDGEIYLEVAQNDEKPFLVHTKAFEVQVLGTIFNVNAYADNVNSVVLVEGSVEVITTDNQKQKIKPNQGLFYDSGVFKIKKVNTELYTSWKDGIMIVDGESLANIFNRLSRYYNLQIIYDMSVANEKYKGRLNLQDSIEDVLYNLSLSSTFTFEREDKVVKINLKNFN